MSFPRYPSYKASGVEWLGDVPGHWEASRLRYVCQCLDGQRIPLNASQRSDKLGDIPYWGANSIVGYVDEALFDEDLVLLGEDGAPFFEPSKPVAFFSQGKVWPNNHVHVLRPTVRGTGTFITYVLNATDYAQFIDGSTRDKLTQGSMNDIPILWPPISEQTQIAAFLDTETAKIDELVAEQRRLMELLKEKRQAVISHAVTQGLNPHAPMKPSGIEWLEDVPVHWEIGPVKRHIARVESGTSVNSSDEPAEDGKLGVLKTSCVYTGKFEPTENKTVVLEDIDRVSCPLKAGTIIVSRMNTPELIGAAGFVDSAPSNLFLPDRLWQIFFSTADARFVHFWTLTSLYRAQVESVCTGTSSSMKNLGQNQFGSFAIAMPPKNEQALIANFLADETAKFDTLTAEAQRAIDLLQERRTALISAAVTGQIDVRHIVRESNHAENHL